MLAQGQKELPKPVKTVKKKKKVEEPAPPAFGEREAQTDPEDSTHDMAFLEELAYEALGAAVAAQKTREQTEEALVAAERLKMKAVLQRSEAQAGFWQG